MPPRVWLPRHSLRPGMPGLAWPGLGSPLGWLRGSCLCFPDWGWEDVEMWLLGQPGEPAPPASRRPRLTLPRCGQQAPLGRHLQRLYRGNLRSWKVQGPREQEGPFLTPLTLTQLLTQLTQAWELRDTEPQEGKELGPHAGPFFHTRPPPQHLPDFLPDTCTTRKSPSVH